MRLNVEPIRDLQKIEEIKNILISKENYRDLLFFVAGVNFALRVGDLLTIRVKDFIENGEIKDYFVLIEEKTKKKNKIYIPKNVKDVFKKYILKYQDIIIDPNNFLFFAKKSRGNFSEKGKQAFTPRWASKILKDLAKKVGIKENIASHSLRKTWGYQARKKGVDISLIQEKLNHSNIRETKLYLGITSDEIEEAVLKLNL